MPEHNPVLMLRQERRAPWIGSVSVQDMDTIDHFCKNGYYVSHYEQIAARAEELINDGLESENIQAKLTHRAKDVESLREKLVRRNMTRPYREDDDIFKDVPDLAGVRIILYTPNAQQRKRVEEIIRSIWPECTHVPHGQSIRPELIDTAIQVKTSDLPQPVGVVHNTRGVNFKKDRTEPSRKRRKLTTKYIPKHIGYEADHYRATMRPDQLGMTKAGIEYKDYRSTDKVEIQVMSALNHAWAEAGHDVLYKQHAFGTPTRDEQRILDSLRGLVSSGDLLLEQFYESVNKRTIAQIKYRDEFGTFLRHVDVLDFGEDADGENAGPETAARVTGYETEFNTEGVDIWFDFLVKRDENYPWVVRKSLMNLGYPDDPTSKIDDILRSFNPTFTPPQGFLAPFCLLHQLLGSMRRQARPPKSCSSARKVSTITIALTLLQTFAGEVDTARRFLAENLKGLKEEYDGVAFVVKDPLRFQCSKIEDGDIKQWPALQSAWNWFQKQSIQENSVCGMMFRLAELRVTKEDDLGASSGGLRDILPRSSTI
jgi:ppGpp synthetase/RelA/SpoT-type nucleotidyltranferase